MTPLEELLELEKRLRYREDSPTGRAHNLPVSEERPMEPKRVPYIPASEQNPAEPAEPPGDEDEEE
jgi:hypothetical protein